SISIVKKPSSVSGKKSTPVLATPTPPVINSSITIKIVMKRCPSTQLTDLSRKFIDEDCCLCISLFSSGRVTTQLMIISTTVNATKKEAIKLNATAEPNSLKILATVRLLHTNEQKTTILVNVEAVIAPATSYVPSSAAALDSLAIEKCR